MHRTTIYCTTEFEGFHRWMSAPVPVDYLRERHRHLFKVRVEKIVSAEDREVEFHLLRRWTLDEIASLQLEPDCELWSCETWARVLLQRLGAHRVEVSEDGENGAIMEVVS